jgi:hypothetical protein
LIEKYFSATKDGLDACAPISADLISMGFAEALQHRRVFARDRDSVSRRRGSPAVYHAAATFSSRALAFYQHDRRQNGAVQGSRRCYYSRATASFEGKVGAVGKREVQKMLASHLDL